MKEETRKALEAELARCDAIRREFSADEMFSLFAIVRGWTMEQARVEFKKRQLIGGVYESCRPSKRDAA